LRVNYYVQLLDSLPKSGVYYPDGSPVAYPAIVNGSIALPDYTYTKTAFREDGTYRVQKIPRADTRDIATFTGYNIEVPNPAPPAPLADHPFLGAREAPIVVESTEDLPTILPSLDAIFQHAVPRTSDPYKDAPPYLKLYDIKLRDVPWSLWRESFPPAELIDESAPPIDIPLKEGATDPPAKILIDAYKTPWYPALSSRKWLTTQLDGGGLLSKFLVSQAGSLGPIAIPPPVVLPDAPPIVGTAEDCLPSTITDFEDFAGRGVYRAPKCATCKFFGHGSSDCPDKKAATEYLPGSGCIPLPFVEKEREEAPFVGKSAWVPGTDATILQDYQALISTYTTEFSEIVLGAPPAPVAPPPSETRTFIVAILKDTRTSDDKLDSIQVLLSKVDHSVTDNIYREENGQFLVCAHTLDYLDGSFERDSDAYIRKWSVVEAGFRTCQYCGERIASVFQDQDQFDESGRVIQRVSKQEKVTEEHVSFAASLKNIQELFDLTSPGEDVFYLMLSLLQILPEDDQLRPILDFVRSETTKTNSKIAGRKLTAKQQSDVNLALAIFGFNGVIVLMQTHLPQLIPRRSFGKPIVMRGFPRDTDDSADAPLIDSMLSMLSTTFESYPSTFGGASVVLLRNILNDRKSVRKVLISSMTKQFIPVFKPKLAKAKDGVRTDVVYALSNTFQPPLFRSEKDLYFLSPSDSTGDGHRSFRCPDANLPWITPSLPFSFRQEAITITDPIKVTKGERLDAPPAFEGLYVPTPTEVRALRKKADFPPLKKVLEYETSEILRGILLEWMSVVGGMASTPPALHEYSRETRPHIEYAYADTSLLRDYFKGTLNEFVSRFVDDETTTSGIERSMVDNLTIRAFFSKADETKKMTDTLRAREREEFKERMRRLPDAQREITKSLIDRGLAAYLITKDDREKFLNEMRDEQAEQVEPVVVQEDRDIGPQGEQPVVGDVPLEYDHGDYGDMRARNADGEEYNDEIAFGDDAVGF
jgi:hypothetical protein